MEVGVSTPRRKQDICCVFGSLHVFVQLCWDGKVFEHPKQLPCLDGEGSEDFNAAYGILVSLL
jgi:hypothetical protein